MAMTRKEFLASAASVGALSACAGTRFWLPRKDSLRKIVTEEDMYKEIYLSLVNGSTTPDPLVLTGMTTIRQYMFAYNGPAELIFPDATNFQSWAINSSTLKSVTFEKRLTNSAYLFSQAQNLEHCYFNGNEKAWVSIIANTYIKDNRISKACILHATDGNVIFDNDSNQWVYAS